MMRTTMLVLVLAAFAHAGDTEAEKLYRDAWWRETSQADLPGALEAYLEATAAEGPEEIRARALLKAAEMNKRLGRTEAALATLEELRTKFPKQAELLATAAERAREWTAIDLRKSYPEWYRRHLFSPEFQARVVDWVLELGTSESGAAFNKLLSVGEAAAPALREALKSGNAELRERAVRILILAGHPPSASALVRDRRIWMAYSSDWIALMRLPAAQRAVLREGLQRSSLPGSAIQAALDSPTAVLSFLRTERGGEFGYPHKRTPNPAISLMRAAVELGGAAARDQLASIAVDAAARQGICIAAAAHLVEGAWPRMSPLERFEWARRLDRAGHLEPAIYRIARELRPAEEELLDAMLGSLVAEGGSRATTISQWIVNGLDDNPATAGLPWTADRAGPLVECAAFTTKGLADYALRDVAHSSRGAESIADALLARVDALGRVQWPSTNKLYQFLTLKDGVEGIEVQRRDGSSTTWGQVFADRAAAAWSNSPPEKKIAICDLVRRIPWRRGRPAALERAYRESAFDKTTPVGLRATLVYDLGRMRPELLDAHFDFTKPGEIEAIMRYVPHMEPGAAMLRALKPALTHPDLKVRREIVDQFSRRKRLRNHIAAFAPLARDADSWIRLQVVRAMADWSTTKALPYLLSATEDESAEIRRAAIPGLRNIGDENALGALKKLTRDPDRAVRSGAVVAINQIQTERNDRALALDTD